MKNNEPVHTFDPAIISVVVYCSLNGLSHRLLFKAVGPFLLFTSPNSSQGASNTIVLFSFVYSLM